MSASLLEYSARTADEVQRDFETSENLRPAPLWMKQPVASVFGNTSALINVQASMQFLATTQDRPTAQLLLLMLDYNLSWKEPATVEIQVTINATATASSPYTIPANQLIFTTRGGSGTAVIRYESRTPLTFAIGETVKTVTAYQQETLPDQPLGTTDGSDFQRFEMPSVDVLSNTVSLDIGGSLYELKDVFTYSSATDQDFLIYYRSDGTSYVYLPGTADNGASVFGKVPAPGLTVTARYAVGGGIIGNAGAGTIEIYAGTDSNVESVTNLEPADNGAEEETIDNARTLAPILLRATEGFTNESTGRALALRVPGVLDAQIESYSVNLFTANVYLLPVGGGVPSPTLKSTVISLLEARSDMRQVVVSAPDPNYTDSAIVARVSMRTDYLFSENQKYVELALALRASEISRIIHQVYDERGTAAFSEVVNQINSDFATLIPYLIAANLYTEADDGVAIRQLLESTASGKKHVPFQVFGEPLDPGDLSAAVIDFVTAVDRCFIDTPASTLDVGPGGLVRPTSISVTEL